MPATAPRKRRSPRTERVNVFCTPKEARDLKVQAALADKPLNQHILDSLGVAEINPLESRDTEADPQTEEPQS